MALSEVQSLQLFKSLIKDGCKWHGDVLSRKWSENLFIEDDVVKARAMQTLSAYKEGTDFKMEGEYSVWIA